MKHATLWFDGASRGNPGPMAGGAVVEIDGRRTVLHGAVGRGTNNEAEYEGLLLGLEHARAAGVDALDVRGDSQLVLRQLEGRYQVRKDHLKPLHARAKRLLGSFQQVHLQWVRRDDNRAADRAANEALDGAA